MVVCNQQLQRTILRRMNILRCCCAVHLYVSITLRKWQRDRVCMFDLKLNKRGRRKNRKKLLFYNVYATWHRSSYVLSSWVHQSHLAAQRLICKWYVCIILFHCSKNFPPQKKNYNNNWFVQVVAVSAIKSIKRAHTTLIDKLSSVRDFIHAKRFPASF